MKIMKWSGFVLCVDGTILAPVDFIVNFVSGKTADPLWGAAIPIAIVIIGIVLYHKGGGKIRL